ncbi:MAG: pitrilysin family protein [bacterium]|nr:pitrilysin family protein [bacterium]
MGLGGAFRKTTLENGVRILTEQVPYVRSVSLGIWVLVGSRDEQESEQGIAHFVEHMLFKGTRTRDAFTIANSLESLGGSLDAFTYRDLTCFHARCLDEHLGVALDVLADMVQHAALDPHEIEKEKTVVLEEIQNVEDTPDDLIHDLFAQSVWGTHPVGAPILGATKTVRGFTTDQIQHFLDRHYRPNRIILSASGNLDHEDLVTRAAELFQGATPSSEPWVRLPPRTSSSLEKHYPRDIGQLHICLGSSAYPYTYPRRYELLIADAALGGGMTSRLFQKVRESLGLAYAVYSYLETLEDTGLFGAYLACEPKSAPRAVKIVREEMRRFRETGITGRELASCKAQLRGELILGLESMDHRMSGNAREEIYTGRYHSPESLLTAIDGITTGGVIEAAQGLLDEQRMQLITVGRS